VRLRAVSLLLLAVLLMPLWAELAENGAHLIGHGDMAHAASAPGHTSPSNEHGCSELFHFCSCCRSVVGEGATALLVPTRLSLLRELVASSAQAPAAALVRSLEYPPRA
jgi:hypothetical protein